MQVFNIQKETEENKYFRNVKLTGNHLQIVYMTLKKGENIGKETHKDTDQFIRIDKGSGEANLDGKTYDVKDGDAIFIPQGTEHDIYNEDKEPLSFYVIYSKKMHPDGEKSNKEGDVKEQLTELVKNKTK
jgi:mannose-6-phosphate isomerase-like protein (cupin superfamily)